MLKIAIVGTGIISGCHIDAIKQIPECELVALCDINEEKVKALAAENNVPYFLNYKDIPGAVDCDAVILNLPHGLHCEASVFFLDSGIHVLVEKPMANTTEECDKMIEAEKRSGKKLGIAHVQRFSLANQKIKEYIETGKLGKLCMYTEQRTINYFLDKRPRWFLDKKMAGGGIVMNYGAHAFDRIFSTTGAKLVSLDANCANPKNDFSVEGHAQIFAKFDNGMTAAITFSGYATSVWESMYFFTEGALRVKGGHGLEMNLDDGNGWVEVPDTKDGLVFVRELTEFCKYVKGEPSIIPTGEYSRQVIDAIEKVYEHIV